MLTFQLIGQIGRFEPLDNGGVRIVVCTQDDWVICDCRDPILSTRLQKRLRAGDSVRLNGIITPRLNTSGGVAGSFEASFIIERFKRLRR